MNIEITNRLYNLRKGHGFSQKKPAERNGIGRYTVSKWERPESFPDIDNLLSMYKIYR